jgi:hypothetical protein
MDISALLESIASSVRSGAGLSVVVGMPDPQADVSIWPWQLLEATATNSPPSRGARDPRKPPTRELDIRFLLVSGTSPDAVANFGKAYAALLDSAVVQVLDVTAEVVPDLLPAGEVAALFSAAAIPLTLSSSFVLRCLA